MTSSLRQQIGLLAALATPEQHRNLSNSLHALNTGLEETSKTVADMTGLLKERLNSADKRAKALERHCEKLERKVNDLDGRVKTLPSIEYDVEPLNAVTQMIEVWSEL